MLSRSALYALQATLHLARQPGNATVSAAAMANRLDVPPEYLAKVLARLRSAGILESTRGAHGGYRLAVPPAWLYVDQVVRPFQRVRSLKRCLLGGRCDPERPCPAHRQRLAWNEARARIQAATSLSDLLDDRTAPNGAPFARRESPDLTYRT